MTKGASIHMLAVSCASALDLYSSSVVFKSTSATLSEALQ